jgi:hypothetical protein
VYFIGQATGDLTIIAPFHHSHSETALAESNTVEKVTDRICYQTNSKPLDE